MNWEENLILSLNNMNKIEKDDRKMIIKKERKIKDQMMLGKERNIGRGYRVREQVVSGLIHTQEYRYNCNWIHMYLRIQRELYLD